MSANILSRSDAGTCRYQGTRGLHARVPGGKKIDALFPVRRDGAPSMNARSIIVVAGLTGLFCAGASALGIVRAPAQVTLGATLNFAVAVQVASDESLTSTCVTADVQQGEQRV